MPMVEDMIAAAAVHWIRRAKWSKGEPWADWIVGELNEVGFGTGQLRHKDLNGIRKKGILSDLTEYLVQQWKWLARDESGRKENKEESRCQWWRT